MKQLLSTKHQAQLLIMEAFLEKNEITIEELESLTGASKQTIRTYIDEVKQSTDFFYIQKGKGTYFLRRNNRTNYSTIYRYFYQQSIQLQLLEIIFLNPFIQTKEIVQRFGISRSQCNQLRHTLKQVCESYGFSLSDSPFRFQGDYHKICAFFIAYMFEKYDFLDDYISPKENQLLDQLVLSFTNLPLVGGLQDKQRLKTWIWVIIKLSKHFPEFLTQEFDNAEEFNLVFSYQDFEETFSVNFSGYLNGIFSQLYQFLEETITMPELVRKKSSIITFFETLYALFDCPHSFDDNRVIDVALLLYVGPNYILNKKKQRFVLNFFEQNSCFSKELSEKLYQEILHLRTAIGNDGLFYELMYSLLINQTTLTRLINEHQEKKRVGVLYTYDKEHSELFSYQLNNSFTNNLAFEVIDYDEFCNAPDNEAELSDFDFIITCLTTLKKENCIVTDIFPTISDIKYLNDLVDLSIRQKFENGLKRALVDPIPTVKL
ncbi:helix-turn-helix domain-containing protein [Enterococcus sp. AZ072]|uniref:helix-turn-helix domain-containing protein n=1 Tax=unclassified Enterococcus TaxID=2608891 RepID=UPI003D29D26E